MRDDYDFSNGVRGKYAKRYAEGTNIVVLAPDVAAEFKDSHAVNEALRSLISIRDESSIQRTLAALARIVAKGKTKSKR
jgi:hypothetical protein